MRVFIAGQKSFGEAVFRVCMSMGLEMAGVSSPSSERDRLTVAASLAGVAWMPSGTLTAETMPQGVDLIVAAHSHDFVGRKTRAMAKYGAIGYHPSLLPRHRGRDAVAWTIKMGDAVAGGSVYWLSENVDAGDIAAQGWCFVRPGDTASELWRRDLFPMGVGLMAGVIADIRAGRVVMVPQDEYAATWEPALSSPPLRRPDLPMIGDGREAYRVIREASFSRT